MTGSAAQAIFAKRRNKSKRAEVLATTTIREFDGGWNVIDNDLNLSSKFAKILENIYRSADGANTVRYGTKLFGDLNNQAATTGSLVTDPLFTTISSAVILVTDVAHGFVSGHSTTFAGSAAIDGIPAGEINATHTVTVVDADSYNITVTTTATAGAIQGGGAGITFSHDNKTKNEDIINMTYFQDRLVMVVDTGDLVEMSSSGVTRVIFNTAIALLLADNPAGWSATSFASFAVFGGQLIVCNGIDKPLLVDFTPDPPTAPVQYLQDIPVGTNLFTPICRYVLAMDHYVIMAGDPANPGLVHISNFDSSGTWLGDADPNDAVQVALDKVVTSDRFAVRGLSRHRDRVVVAFDDNLVLGILNLVDDAMPPNHTPDFTDVIEQHGSIAHRSLAPLGNDLLMCDLVGVPSLARALFTGAIKPERVSELIDPEIQSLLVDLSVGSSEDRVFAVYNQPEGQYMLFIPNADTIGGTTETLCFVYTAVTSIKLKAWSLFKGWNFSCAARSALNRIFFAGNSGNEAKRVYVYGARVDKFYGDLIDDPDIAEPDDGKGVAFKWELPWADFDQRMHTKKSRYIGFDTTGTAQFEAKMFVDNIYADGENPGSFLPTLVGQFVGGGSPGFGGGAQPYGGGRRTSDERLWAWPTKFKIAKLQFSGSSVEPLAFVAVTLAYQEGSVRR